jgi:hypothetical protein
MPPRPIDPRPGLCRRSHQSSAVLLAGSLARPPDASPRLPIRGSSPIFCPPSFSLTSGTGSSRDDAFPGTEDNPSARNPRSSANHSGKRRPSRCPPHMGTDTAIGCRSPLPFGPHPKVGHGMGACSVIGPTRRPNHHRLPQSSAPSDIASWPQPADQIEVSTIAFQLPAVRRGRAKGRTRANVEADQAAARRTVWELEARPSYPRLHESE